MKRTRFVTYARTRADRTAGVTCPAGRGARPYRGRDIDDRPGIHRPDGGGEPGWHRAAPFPARAPPPLGHPVTQPAELPPPAGGQLLRPGGAAGVYRQPGSPLAAALAYPVSYAALLTGGPLRAEVAGLAARRSLLITLAARRAMLAGLLAIAGLPLA